VAFRVTWWVSEKFAQNVAQPIFGQYYHISFTEEKSCRRMWTNSILFIKLPKVNNRPMGENSPNLVTLVAMANWITGTIL
jgi:hypothetical protein